MRNDSPATLDIDNKPVFLHLFVFFSLLSASLILDYDINVTVGKEIHNPSPKLPYFWLRWNTVLWCENHPNGKWILGPSVRVDNRNQ